MLEGLIARFDVSGELAVGGVLAGMVILVSLVDILARRSARHLMQKGRRVAPPGA